MMHEYIHPWLASTPGRELGQAEPSKKCVGIGGAKKRALNHYEVVISNVMLG